MSSPLAVPPELVRDAIAQIDAHGQLHPCTEAMRDWLAKFSDKLHELPLDDEQLAGLHHGVNVTMTSGEEAWQLACKQVGETSWLVVRSMATHERYLAGLLHSARCRSLANSAAMLSHDLSNQFNAALALLSHLDVSTLHPDDRAAIRELERGAKLGARMATAVARLLVHRNPGREVVQPAAVFGDALAVLSQSMVHAGVDFHSEVADGLPEVRASYVEAVQSVMAVLAAMQHVGPRVLRCVMVMESVAVAGGRARECVVLRCLAAPLADAAMQSLLTVVNAERGLLAAIASHPDVYEELANAAFAQKRLGGDLSGKEVAGGLQLQIVWPALRV